MCVGGVYKGILHAYHRNCNCCMLIGPLFHHIKTSCTIVTKSIGCRSSKLLHGSYATSQRIVEENHRYLVLQKINVRVHFLLCF